MAAFKLSDTQRLPLVLLLAASLGFASVVIPGLLNSTHIPPSPLIPQVQAAVKNMPVFSYFLLFLTGALLGTVEPRRPRLIGVCSIIVFPIVTVIEKSMDITSHPQMSWEITYYFLLGLSSVFGAYLGKELRS